MDLVRAFKPDKTLSPSQTIVNFVRTSDKFHTVWQYLKRYQNVDFVKSKLSSCFPAMSTKLKNKKAQHITDALRQSEAYFNTSIQTDLSIKPLIIYYGMLNLAKVLIMFGDNKHTLDDLEKIRSGFEKHGLQIGCKTKKDRQIRNSQRNLFDEFCYVQNQPSVFKLLHACWSKRDLDKQMRFSIKTLSLSHPYSWRQVNGFANEVPNCFSVSGGFRRAKKHEHVVNFPGHTMFSLYNKPDSVEGGEYLKTLLPRLSKHYDRNLQSSYEFVSKSFPLTIDEYCPVYKSVNGESYIVGDINAGYTRLALHPIEIEYLAMFILGNLTRYIPQKWLKNVHYDGGVEMSTLEGLIGSTTISFPKMVLEELDGEEYIFTGDVSYWGI